MSLIVAPRNVTSVIYWAVSRAFSSAEFDAYAVSATRIDAKPGKVLATGTVTLRNGGKRKAEQFYGSLSGRIFTRYQAPNGGRWKLADEYETASFTRNA